MPEFLQNYLSYLRDCQRQINRDSPTDFLGRSTRGEVFPLVDGDIRQLETTKAIQTKDPKIMGWANELSMTAEGEQQLLFGFSIVVGKIGPEKFCAPFVIAEADLSRTSTQEIRLTLKTDSIRLYSPLLTRLLSEGTDGDPEVINDRLAQLGDKLPVTFRSVSEMGKIVSEIKTFLSSKITIKLHEYGNTSCNLKDMQRDREEGSLKYYNTAMLFSSRPVTPVFAPPGGRGSGGGRVLPPLESFFRRERSL